MIAAFITVRTQSTRLPEKCLLPFGEENVLEHVIRRAKHYHLDPIICTTIQEADDCIEAIAKRENAKVFRGSVANKLKRWLDCCDAFKLSRFHSVDADDPFFDGELVHQSMRLLSKGYDVVAPTISSSKGDASVGYSLTRDIIKKACDLAESEDTEMMWYYLEKVPGLRITILPEKVRNPKDLRLTLDYEEDYWLLRSVKRMVGTFASREEVDEIFERNPDLYKVNWFRNEQWQQGQEAKRI